MEIKGCPILGLQLTRLKDIIPAENIVVATSTNERDDVIVDYCNSLGIASYRGSENDVLSRIVGALKSTTAEYHLELFGDSPLVDQEVFALHLAELQRSPNSVISNSKKTTFPPGSEMLLYRSQHLIDLDNLIDKNDPLREHVGSNFLRFPKKFDFINVEAPCHLKSPNLFLEIDELADYHFFKVLINEIGIQSPLREIIQFTKTSNIPLSNSEVERKWKTFRDVD